MQTSRNIPGCHQGDVRKINVSIQKLDHSKQLHLCFCSSVSAIGTKEVSVPENRMDIPGDKILVHSERTSAVRTRQEHKA